MTATFYAQPYNISAEGFYFHDEQTYRETIKSVADDYGQPVEEFEIQFIDGTVLNSKLAKAIEPNQSNIIAMMEVMAKWTEQQKIKVIFAVDECGYSFNLAYDDPDALDIEIYADMTLSDLAYQFVDEGLFGEIPEHLVSYINYEVIARDLAAEYTESSIGGDSYVYRCA